MLSRTAARSLAARTAATPFPRAPAAVWRRTYAKVGKPPSSQSPNQSNRAASDSSQDHTWKANDPIKFAAGGAKAASEAGKASQGANPAKPSDFSKEQTEFDADASPERNTAPETDVPKGPLPDLRQGIPSTFDMEFGGAKPKDAKQAQDANVAEEGAEQSSSGAGEGGRDEGELPKSAYETSMDRRWNTYRKLMYGGMGLAGIVGAVYLGRNWETEEEERQHADAPNGWGLKLMYDRAQARISGEMSYYTEPTFPKLLPAMDPAPPYTLVLSLEDLLIHSEWSREHGWRTAKRPGLDYFLRYLSQYYELVIFTSLPSTSADPIIRKLDPFRIVMWPLFREATRYEKGQYIKDLSYLNRDLSKVILVDTKPEHAKLQPENAIVLPPWKGQPGDKGLVGLIPFLEYIATMGITDVREAIKSFEGKDIPTEFAIREGRAREAFKKQLEEERAKKPKHSAGKWLMGALGLKPQGGLAVGEESFSEGLEKGKMLSDQIRERGMKQYEAMEKEIRENGEKWLAEMAAEEKRAQEEQMKSMKSGLTGWFGKPTGPEQPKSA